MNDFCSRFHERLVPFMGVFLLVIYLVTYSTNRFGLPVRADGLGYYAYLPSYLIAHDPTMGARAADHFGGEFPAWSAIERYGDSDRYLDRFNIGVAVMMLPFFVLAHIITLAIGLISPASSASLPPDGYSFFYQHAAGLAGLFYVVAGLRVLQVGLRRWFCPSSIAFGLIALVVGTNLTHYGSGESVMSHAYSFFLGACLVVLVPRWYEQGMPVRLTMGLGLVAGLVPLVRITAALTLVFIPLYGVLSGRDVADRARELMGRAGSVLLLAAVACAVFFPQMAVWKFITGHWLVNSYGDRGLPNLLHPELLNTLFSYKKGLFFWSPVLLAGVIGFWRLRKSVPACFASAIIIIPVQIYVIASADVWYAGGSFGQRYFIDVLPFFALPICALHQTVEGPRDRKWLYGYAGVCAVWTLGLMCLFYRRDLSYYGLDANAFFDILWTIKQFVVGHRG